MRHTLASTNNCDCAQDLGIYFRTRKNKRSKVCDLFIEKIFVATVVIASRTYTHTQTQTHVHTDTQTHRHIDAQTHRHTDMQCDQGHLSVCLCARCAQTHMHTDIQTPRYTVPSAASVCVSVCSSYTNTQTHGDADTHCEQQHVSHRCHFETNHVSGES